MLLLDWFDVRFILVIFYIFLMFTKYLLIFGNDGNYG
jgi:hypothetical protein